MCLHQSSSILVGTLPWLLGNFPQLQPTFCIRLATHDLMQNVVSNYKPARTGATPYGNTDQCEQFVIK